MAWQKGRQGRGGKDLTQKARRSRAQREARDEAQFCRDGAQHAAPLQRIVRQRRSWMISRAALAPEAPVRPLPGWVPEPHR